MDLLLLHGPSEGYAARDLIEGYDSLIWTERFEGWGDFQLKTKNVRAFFELLPEMTFLSLLNSTEIMMVETHEIARSKQGVPELTITGRSIDAFAEERWLEGPYQKRYRMPSRYTAAQTASVLLWNAFVNPTERDVTHVPDWFRFSTDSLPQVAISDSTTTAGNAAYRYLESGQLYPQLVEVLHWNRLGIRGVRPTREDPVSKVVTVGTGGSALLTYSNIRTPDKIRFDIYNGRNLQIDVAPEGQEVVFHHATGELEDEKYLFSVKGLKTVATIVSGGYMNGGVKVKAEGLSGNEGTSSTGWNRRAVWLDGGSRDDNDTLDDYYEGMINHAEVELGRNQRTKMFDGKISNLSQYKYGVHYSLGDRVTVLGDYGIQQPMRVVEYIRSVDLQNAESGYPGLAVID